ncbi:MAG: phosphatase PAP2 family protein [Clostridia bacterium]|nr:phosphatase PAP2 family protein [Clostridia bacterium]
MIQFSKKQKLWFVLSVAMLTLFVIWTLVVKFVDVDQVGLSHLNQFFWQRCGKHEIWARITKWLGYLCILVVACLVIWQVVQWVRRKSLWRVDKNLLLFNLVGVLFLVVYVFFEIVVINYRPLLDNGVAKASYPSSHAMLFVVVLSLLIWQVWHYYKSKSWQVILTVALTIFMVIGVVGRLFSGVHWFTDIVAGVIMGYSLVCFYLGLVSK